MQDWVISACTDSIKQDVVPGSTLFFNRPPKEPGNRNPTAHYAQIDWENTSLKPLWENGLTMNGVDEFEVRWLEYPKTTWVPRSTLELDVPQPLLKFKTSRQLRLSVEDLGA